MLINPSFLFDGKFDDVPSWVYVKVDTARPLFIVVCECRPVGYKSCYSIEQGPPKNDTFIQVACTANEIRVENQSLKIWTGQCERCKRVLWGCDSWNWVEWMSDASLLKTVLDSVPIQHIAYGDVSSPRGIAIHKGTRIAFEKGKLKYSFED